MPAADQYPTDYDPPRKFVLVVSCVDYRLLDDLGRFLAHDNLTDRYYQVAFAGASLGLSAKAPKGPGRPQFARWRAAFRDHLNLTWELTAGGLSGVHVVEQRGCGAYEKFAGGPFGESADDRRAEAALHAEYAAGLAAGVADWAEGLGAEVHPPRVLGFLMDLRGAVDRLPLPAAGKRGPAPDG